MIKNVVVKRAGKKGKGVFAARSFHKGEVVFINKRGRLVKNKNLKRLYKKEGDHLNEIDDKTWEIMKPPGRFLNHSCDPNVIAKEFAKKAVPYIALRAIKKGEEITGDYRINAHTGNKWKCYCKSKYCKEFVISDFFSLSLARQRKYLSYAPNFIQKEYQKRHRL